MERRELLSLGGVAAIAGIFAGTESAQAQGAGKKVLRVYADADGNSHVDEVPIATKAGRVFRSAPLAPATGMVYAEYTSSSTEDWHRAPGRQFSISLSGEIEVEVSGGVKHAIHAGDIVFLEDLQGKGHITRLLSPVTNIFIRVPENFDLLAWARGEA
jgi:quercetin dioxygenase-like cupin family protein